MPAPDSYRATMIDQSTHLMGALGDMQILATLRFDGRLDEARLVAALRRLVAVDPILGCRFVASPWRPRWRRRRDLDRLRWVDVIPVAGEEARHAALEAVFSSPHDDTVEPLIRARVLRGAQDTLALVVDHRVADAGGVKGLLARLALAYRDGEEADPRALAVPDRGRGLWHVIRHMGPLGPLRVLWRSLRDTLRGVLPPRAWGFPWPRPDRGPWGLCVRRVPEALVSAVHERASRLGASLNDALLAAYLRALVRRIKPAPGVPLRLMTTADLRRYLPPDEPLPTANLSGPVYVRVEGLGASPLETLTRVRDEMRWHKAGPIGMGQLAGGAVLLKLFPFRVAQWLIPAVMRTRLRPLLTPPAFSNTGALDPARLDFGGPRLTDAAIHAPAFQPPYLLTSASGFRGRMTLSAGFSLGAISRGEMGAFMDGVVQEIEALSAAPDPD
jgi:NRPS condensation-like uncharacterized protein